MFLPESQVISFQFINCLFCRELKRGPAICWPSFSIWELRLLRFFLGGSVSWWRVGIGKGYFLYLILQIIITPPSAK